MTRLEYSCIISTSCSEGKGISFIFLKRERVYDMKVTLSLWQFMPHRWKFIPVTLKQGDSLWAKLSLALFLSNSNECNKYINSNPIILTMIFWKEVALSISVEDYMSSAMHKRGFQNIDILRTVPFCCLPSDNF